MEFKDYYKTLGLVRTASQAEIKKAYRKLARQHHPDVKPGDKAAEQRFKELNEANAVLGDPEKRKRYDALGPNWEAYSQAAGANAGGPFAGFGQAGQGGQGGIRYEFRTTGSPADLGGFSDFFRMVFGDEATVSAAAAGNRRGRTTQAASGASFDDVLSQLGLDGRQAGGSAGAGRTATAPRPATVEATAELSLEEAFHGTSRLVEIDGKRLEVSIPRGVDSGTRIRLTGKGGDGRDLIVVCRVRPHPTFTRRGADLERELSLTLEEALLGAEVPVSTLKGRVLLTVPPGTQPGKVFRLTGQGMPRFKGSGSGDLYARTKVILPTLLTDDAKLAARRFFELADQPDPR